MSPMLRIKKGELLPSGERLIIKAGEYLETLQAGAVLQEARERAEAIVSQARLEYEREKERGFSEGLEAGKQVMAERIMNAAATSVESLASIEEEMVHVVIHALKKIIGEIDDRERLVRVVRTSLALMRNQRKVVLRVPPDRAEMADAAVREMLQSHPGIDILEVVADPRLKNDGCILESDMGIVDAGLEGQIEAIRRALLRRIRP